MIEPENKERNRLMSRNILALWTSVALFAASLPGDQLVAPTLPATSTTPLQQECTGCILLADSTVSLPYSVGAAISTGGNGNCQGIFPNCQSDACSPGGEDIWVTNNHGSSGPVWIQEPGSSIRTKIAVGDTLGPMTL